MTDKSTVTVSQVAQVIEDCQSWLSGLLSSFFYSVTVDSSAFRLPDGYAGWIESPSTKSGFQKSLLEDIADAAAEMKVALDEAREVNPPLRVSFEKFLQSYEKFISHLNRAQNELILAGSGVDKITGFKINSLMLPEIRRELDRRGRKGNPFSLALLRLDGSVSSEERDFKLRAISTALRQGLRSFDDVYRMGDVDLLVALKHADIKGGIRFIERLKAELKNLQADFTFSSCVGEPDPADDLESFLVNLENDLTQIATHGGGQTMKHEEISPLQRFVSSLKNK